MNTKNIYLALDTDDVENQYAFEDEMDCRNFCVKNDRANIKVPFSFHASSNIEDFIKDKYPAMPLFFNRMSYREFKQMMEEYAKSYYDNNRVKEAQKWISVDKSLPKINMEVFIYVMCDESIRDSFMEKGWNDGVRFWDHTGRIGDAIVTHWMPLPERPKWES